MVGNVGESAWIHHLDSYSWLKVLYLSPHKASSDLKLDQIFTLMLDSCCKITRVFNPWTITWSEGQLVLTDLRLSPLVFRSSFPLTWNYKSVWVLNHPGLLLDTSVEFIFSQHTKSSRRVCKTSNTVIKPAVSSQRIRTERVGHCGGGTWYPGKMELYWVGSSSRYRLVRVSHPWWSYSVSKHVALGFFFFCIESCEIRSDIRRTLTVLWSSGSKTTRWD